MVVMAENFSVERRKLMRFLGAKVVLTPAAEKGSGMVAKAAELAQVHGWFLCRQFENEANPDFHSRTTAVEILEVFRGRPARLLGHRHGDGRHSQRCGAGAEERNGRRRKIVVCEPDNSPLLGSGIFFFFFFFLNYRPHPMQGWTPDFVPKLADDAVKAGFIDEILPIKGADALRLDAQAAAQEGRHLDRYHRRRHFGRRSADQLRGPSKGAKISVHVAGHWRALSEHAPFRGHSDRNDRRGDRDLAVHASLPLRCRAGTLRRLPQPAAGTAAAARSRKRRPSSTRSRATLSEPVVMFAHEWCEFCWSVRRLFKAFNIPYRSIDLDAADYQRERPAAERSATWSKPSHRLSPQFRKSSSALATSADAQETFDAFNDGRLQTVLSPEGHPRQADAATRTRIRFCPSGFNRAGPLPSGRLRKRQAPGGIPTCLLKARLNAASEPKPTSAATCAMLMPCRSSKPAASCSRQLLRY